MVLPLGSLSSALAAACLAARRPLAPSGEQGQHIGEEGMCFALFAAGQDLIGSFEVDDHRVVGYDGTDGLFASGRVRDQFHGFLRMSKGLCADRSLLGRTAKAKVSALVNR